MADSPDSPPLPDDAGSPDPPSFAAFEAMVQRRGRYPIDAYLFVQKAIASCVEQVHGDREAEQDQDADSFTEEAEESHDPDDPVDLPALMGDDEDEPDVELASRHVTGEQLCNTLRDLAIARWGLLALTVLRRWNIRGTEDFGRIVFDLVENRFLSKTEEDSLDDFVGVYEFSDAFGGTYQIPARIDVAAEWAEGAS